MNPGCGAHISDGKALAPPGFPMEASFGALRRFQLYGFYDPHGILPPHDLPRPSKIQFRDLTIPQYRSPPIPEASRQTNRGVPRALRAAKGFEASLRPYFPNPRGARRRRGGRPPRISQAPKSSGTPGGPIASGRPVTRGRGNSGLPNSPTHLRLAPQPRLPHPSYLRKAPDVRAPWASSCSQPLEPPTLAASQSPKFPGSPRSPGEPPASGLQTL